MGAPAPPFTPKAMGSPSHADYACDYAHYDSGHLLRFKLCYIFLVVNMGHLDLQCNPCPDRSHAGKWTMPCRSLASPPPPPFPAPLPPTPSLPLARALRPPSPYSLILLQGGVSELR